MSSPLDAADRAAWIVVNAQPLGHTFKTAARAVTGKTAKATIARTPASDKWARRTNLESNASLETPSGTFIPSSALQGQLPVQSDQVRLARGVTLNGSDLAGNGRFVPRHNCFADRPARSDKGRQEVAPNTSGRAAGVRRACRGRSGGAAGGGGGPRRHPGGAQQSSGA